MSAKNNIAVITSAICKSDGRRLLSLPFRLGIISYSRHYETEQKIVLSLRWLAKTGLIPNSYNAWLYTVVYSSLIDDKATREFSKLVPENEGVLLKDATFATICFIALERLYGATK